MSDATGGLRFDDRMSDADALLWVVERDPNLRSTITAVVVLDQAPDPAVLRARVERGTRLVPRLRQRVVANPFSIAPPRWETDPNFDLGYHLRHVRAPGEGTIDDLLRLAEPVAMQGFDRARPLWELVVVDGLADGRAGLVLKIHHAITDGVGAVKIALVLFDTERHPATLPEAPDAPEPRVLSQVERAIDALEHESRRWAGISNRLPDTLRRVAAVVAADPSAAAEQAMVTAASVARLLAPSATPASPLMRNRSLSVRFDPLSLSLDELKGAANRAGCRLNDAFVAGVLGGFRRYHEHHGVDCAALRLGMPINVRNEGTAEVAGNQFVPTRFLVPLGVDDPAERMRLVRDLVAEQRAEPALGLVEPSAGVLRRLPAFLTAGLFGSMLKGVDLTTSNVPGVPFPLFVAGARIDDQFAFGPVSGAAANLTLVSYLDRVQVGVNTDPAAVPDPLVLHGCLVDGFAEVLKA